MQNNLETLLIIDDAAIRKPFSERAEKIIRKTDRLAQACASFYSKDQELFDRWYQLTFREETTKIDEAQQELKELIEFHNSLVAITQMFDIEMHEAYKLLKNEEHMYATGDEKQRRVIEEAREARAAFIEEEVRREHAERQREFDEEYEELKKSRAKDSNQSTREELNELQQEFVAKVRGATDEELRAAVRDEDDCIEFLARLIGSCGITKEYDLFLRVWDLTSGRNKAAFAKLYKKSLGIDFHSILAEMRNQAYDQEQRAFDLEDDEFEGLSGARRPDPFKAQSNPESVKLIYRKLAKQLHPDAQDKNLPEKIKSWFLQAWSRLQKAYQNRDLLDLRKLEVIVFIRAGKLNDLTMDELGQGMAWLVDDFNRLKDESASIRRSPAWKFSQKKNHTLAVKKVTSELRAQLHAVKGQVNMMKRDHLVYERLNQYEDSPQNRRSRNRRRNSNGARREVRF